MRLLLGLLVLFLAACGGKGQPPVSAPAPAPVTPVEAPADPQPAAAREPAGVKATLVPLAAPGKYEIHLEWEPGGVFAEQWWVQRVKPSDGVRAMVRLPTDARRFTVTDVPLGVDHEYRVYAHNDGTNAEIGAVALHPYPDRVFPKGEHLWKGGRFGRMFFEKGSLLTLGDYEFDQQLLELHSDGGIIRHHYDPAAPGQAGVSSRPIQLKVGRARGQLEIVSDAQVGGKGADGAPGAPGAAGRDAFAGKWETGKHLIDGTIWSIVRQAPRAAERGGRGGDGAAGEPGLPGGDGGAISLTVEDAEGFWPRLSSAGGLGGDGGEGGSPGAGGRGGKAAAAVEGLGPAWPAGGEGLAGKPGAKGKPGAAGKPGPQYLKLGDRVFRRY